MIKKTALLGIVSLMRLLAFGQDSNQVLSTVVIQEERIPVVLSESTRSVTVLTHEDLKQQNITNLNEALSYVAGIDLRQRGPNGVQADVGVRGGSFDQTLILVNGMKVSDPQTGHHSLNLPIHWSSIERIEILKGSGARVYGPNAYAGAINIITKPKTDKNLYLSGLGGQNSLRGVTMGLQLPVKSYKQFLSVNYAAADSFNYNTDFENLNLLYHGELPVGKSTYSAMLGFNSRKFGANGYYASSSFKDQYEETESSFLAVKSSHKWSKKWNMRTAIYARTHNDHYVFIRDKPEVFQNFHESLITAAEINTTYRSSIGMFNAGIDVRNEQIESSNLGNRNRDIASAFLDYKVVLAERLIVNPGLNVTSISGYAPHIFPGIDFGYKLSQKLNAFGSVSNSYRIPTYTDLYYVGAENIGNTDLLPEEAMTYEIGVKKLDKPFNWSIAAFARQSQNAIEWVRENDSAKWQPRNFHQVQHLGIEVEAGLDGRKMWKNQNFLNRLNFGYTHLSTDFQVQSDLSSKYQINSLRHQAVVSINHQIYKSLKHQISLRYVDRMGGQSYWLVDSRVYWEWKAFMAFVEATNLTNVDYIEAGFSRMPGRWIRAGLRVNVNLERD